MNHISTLLMFSSVPFFLMSSGILSLHNFLEVLYIEVMLIYLLFILLIMFGFNIHHLCLLFLVFIHNSPFIHSFYLAEYFNNAFHCMFWFIVFFIFNIFCLFQMLISLLYFNSIFLTFASLPLTLLPKPWIQLIYSLGHWSFSPKMFQNWASTILIQIP